MKLHQLIFLHEQILEFSTFPGAHFHFYASYKTRTGTLLSWIINPNSNRANYFELRLFSGQQWRSPWDLYRTRDGLPTCASSTFEGVSSMGVLPGLMLNLESWPAHTHTRARTHTHTVWFQASSWCCEYFAHDLTAGSQHLCCTLTSYKSLIKHLKTKPDGRSAVPRPLHQKWLFNGATHLELQITGRDAHGAQKLYV